MAATDVLIVSLGGTTGLREADAQLAGSLRRAGAEVATATTERPREWRTFALTDLAWARSARAATRAALAEHAPRAVVYSSSTAALLRPVPGAIRFDAPAAGNRPGRHGLWQRPVERKQMGAAPLLLPWSEGGLAEAPAGDAEAIVLPVAVEASGGPPPLRDVAALTYGANPEKKGLDRVVAAWRKARRGTEELWIAGVAGEDEPGIRYLGALPGERYRSLLRRARVFVTAPRREDYGIAQLEALADGCKLVTTPSPGPYAAMPLARALDPRLVTDELAPALRIALDEKPGDYSQRAAALLDPWRLDAIDAVVRDEVLPRLLGE